MGTADELLTRLARLISVMKGLESGNKIQLFLISYVAPSGWAGENVGCHQKTWLDLTPTNVHRPKR